MIASSDIITVPIGPVCERGVPMPRHIKETSNPVTRAFVLLGDVVVKNLLKCNSDEFSQQLPAARRYKASAVGVDPQGRRLGFSPQGSLIKHSDRVIDKNMFVPSHLLERPDKRLDIIFIAYFIRTNPLHDVVSAEVAGWLDLPGLLQTQGSNPDQFTSKIRTVAVPCTKLYPLHQLPEFTLETCL